MKNTGVPTAVPAVRPCVTQLWTPYLSELFSGGDFAWPPSGWSVQVTIAFPIFRRFKPHVEPAKFRKPNHFEIAHFTKRSVFPPFLFGPSKSWWFWSPIPNHLEGRMKEFLAKYPSSSSPWIPWHQIPDSNALLRFACKRCFGKNIQKILPNVGLMVIFTLIESVKNHLKQTKTLDCFWLILTFKLYPKQQKNLVHPVWPPRLLDLHYSKHLIHYSKLQHSQLEHPGIKSLIFGTQDPESLRPPFS